MTRTASDSVLEVLPDRSALMTTAAERVVTAAGRAISDHDRFTWVLAGGATPRDLYTLLASAPFKDRIDWSKVELFWGDERCVPPDHPQSNYRMVRETLLDIVRPEQRHVHRMCSEGEPEQAAADYAGELARAFPIGRLRKAGSPPRFDLILLGMGEDGHTASLFPGTTALDERERWVVPAPPAAGGPWRLTLTLPVLNEASHVCFLVGGASKRDRVAAILQSSDAQVVFPAARVRPRSGTLRWLLDADAAALLDNRTRSGMEKP